MMRTLAAVVLLGVALPAIATAQPEDRRRAPTGGGTVTADPCAVDAAGERMRAPSTASPAYDPRVPMPAGATSFTGVAPPGIDPSRNGLQAPQPDQSAQSAQPCPPQRR